MIPLAILRAGDLPYEAACRICGTPLIVTWSTPRTAAVHQRPRLSESFSTFSNTNEGSSPMREYS